MKYGENMQNVVKKSICSSLQIKRVKKGGLLIDEMKKDNEFYCLL